MSADTFVPASVVVVRDEEWLVSQVPRGRHVDLGHLLRKAAPEARGHGKERLLGDACPDLIADSA